MFRTGAAALLALTAVVALLAARAHADDAPAPGPVRVTISCEGYGRTKACPAFLLGLVDANPILLASPRAAADVVVYANAIGVAATDKLHLRFVGKIAGAPPVVEIDVDLDTRVDDDTQRGQLEPAFLRGVALFVAARHPRAVTIALTAPAAAAVAVAPTTPWGFSLEAGGFGSWTRSYQSYNGWSSLDVSRLDKRSRGGASISARGGLSRSPPLVVDGVEVSLDTRQWSLGASGAYARLLDRCWSAGGKTEAWRDDPKGQFRFGWRARAGVEWDRFGADDPRGNRLAVLYAVGYQVEGYNLRNVLRERFAAYPTHELAASGSLRADKIGYGLSLTIGGELLHPRRRHAISASPFIEWQLGAHVDVTLQFSVTKRELPGPDPDAVDQSDFELISRASYAEPLSAYGSLSIRVHWDRTNGARNDRLTDL